MTIEGASASAQLGKPHKEWRAPALLRVATLMPFGLALAIHLLAGSRFGRPMFDQPAVAGIPFGLVVGGLVLAWAALGALIVWTTGSRVVATLAYVFITLPSMFAVVMGPAILLIIQNLP